MINDGEAQWMLLLWESSFNIYGHWFSFKWTGHAQLSHRKQKTVFTGTQCQQAL